MILSILLAIVFLLSFYMKAKKIYNLKYEVFQYQVVPSKYLFLAGIVLLMIEFYLFIAFCTNVFKEVTAILAILFLSVLSLLTYRKRILSGDSTCSCFGEVRILNKMPILRNLAIGLLVIIWWAIPIETDLTVSIFNIVLSVCFVLIVDIVVGIKTIKEMVK